MLSTMESSSMQCSDGVECNGVQQTAPVVGVLAIDSGSVPRSPAECASVGCTGNRLRATELSAMEASRLRRCWVHWQSTLAAGSIECDGD